MQERTSSYGQGYKLTLVDRFGVWLSKRAIKKFAGDLHGKSIADLGCGFHAKTSSSLLNEVKNAYLIDVSLSQKLFSNPKITAVEGLLPDVTKNLSADIADTVLCMSVLEHLNQPQEAINEMYRILKPEGICIINVPSWLGKVFLEFSAFTLHLSPADEMDDHKMYYNPKDLWPMLIKAGFRPSKVKCFRHKFFLNTLAVCKK